MAPLVLGASFRWGRHINYISTELMKVETGEQLRKAISLAPGAMKSMLTSVLFPAWCLGRHPYWQIMILSHSADLALFFSRKVRTLFAQPEFQEIFPGAKLDEDNQAANRWMTTARGVFCAFGEGANLAGNRGNLIILDDIMSEKTAKSKQERTRIIKDYPAGIRSRLIPDNEDRPGRMVCMHTRWNLGDMIAYFQKETETGGGDMWDFISIPAILDEESAKLLGLKEGDSFWPELQPLDELLKTKAGMGAVDWSAVYMQRPTPEEGSIFKEKYFRVWKLPDPPKCEFIIQTIDTAMTKETYSDYSVIQTWGIFFRIETDSRGFEVEVPHCILLGNWREKVDYPELRAKAQALYLEMKPDVVIIEKKNFGIALIVDLLRAGYPVRAYNPDRDKVSRANAITPIMDSGRVWIPRPGRFKWAYGLLTEALNFTPTDSHEHDDQVDTMCLAISFMQETFVVRAATDPREEQEVEKRVATYWS